MDRVNDKLHMTILRLNECIIMYFLHAINFDDVISIVNYAKCSKHPFNENLNSIKSIPYVCLKYPKNKYES